MNGVEFIRTAKEKYPQKMYYLASGFAIDTPAIQEAMEIKLIVKYLRKPINKNVLLDIINEAVNIYCT
jgi:YesN/AraC family two-component response regulator